MSEETVEALRGDEEGRLNLFAAGRAAAAAISEGVPPGIIFEASLRKLFPDAEFSVRSYDGPMPPEPSRRVPP